MTEGQGNGESVLFHMKLDLKIPISGLPLTMFLENTKIRPSLNGYDFLAAPVPPLLTFYGKG
jgi:hypothetical protein